MTSRIGRIFWLAVVLLVLGACSGDSAEPIVEDLPLLAERDFATSDLHFLELSGDGPVHRFNPSDASSTEIEIARPADSFVFTLATGTGDRGLYFVTQSRESNLAEIQEVEGDVLYTGALASCLSSGHDEKSPIAITHYAPNEQHDGPVASTWFEVGADKINELQKFDPHVFCPVRGPQPGQWAVAEDVEMTDLWTTELVLSIDGDVQKLRWNDCVLMPTDFTADGGRLAMGATCQDTSKSGLYVVDVRTLETADQPLIQGAIGAARWSPSDRLIAFTHHAIDEAGDPAGPQLTVKVLRPSDGAIEVMPVANTSWPAWVLRDDANGTSSRS